MPLSYAPPPSGTVGEIPSWLPEKFRRRINRVTPPPSSVTPPPTLNSTSRPAADRQLQVPGEGAPLRIVLGMDCIGAQVGCWWYHGNYLVLRCIWSGGGAHEGVQSVTLNGEPLPASVLVTHYTGAAGQGIDPWLAAAAAAQTPAITYTDTLPGIAYSVFKLPRSTLTAPPEFTAVIKGLKLYDPRTSTTAWTDNAGLALRAFLTSAWGENKPVTGGDVALADRCDELCGTAPNQEKRCRIGLTLDTRQTADAWRETLRTLAECFVVPDGEGYLLIPDAPASSEYTYSHDAGNLLDLGALKKSGSGNLPTVMTIWYTDRSVTPWKDKAIEPIKRPGVDAGTTPWRPQEIRLNGIFSAGQAHRIGTMRLNKLWLCDLTGDIHTLDDGLQVRPGTVVTLVDPRLGAGKTVRVFGSSGVNGQYVQQFVEHDNAVYTDSVIEDPSTPDTTYPLPNNPPPITGLTISEVFVPMQTGRGGTRFNVSWTAADYIFLAGYRVECWAGTQLIDSAPVSSEAYASPFLQEGIYYTIKVATLSSVAQSEWVQDAALAQGKLLKPGDVPFFNAYELGNVVYFFITPGADMDRTGHEYRRATINGAETIEQHWARGTLVNRVADPAVRYESPNEPVGTWRYMVKCLDSVRSDLYPFGQESVNAAYKDVTVTSDAKSFWSDSYQFTTHTLTNMVEYLDYPPTRDKYISTNGASINAALPNAANTYPNPIATYAAPASSEFLTESHDFGALVAGQWFVDIATENCSVADLTGTHTVTLELSANGTAWTPYSGTSVVASGRYARVRVGSNGVMVVTGNPTVRVQAAPKTEVKTVTTSASGPVTLTLDKHYIAYVSINTQSVGATQASHSWDNAQLSPTAPNTVQIRAWNQAGAFVATQVQVTFNGILA